jgi:diguanylate cyclase
MPGSNTRTAHKDDQVICDVTEHRRAKDALREHQERLRVTLASISDAVITNDSTGHVDFLNPVAEGFTGWPAEEAIGRSLDDVFQVIDEDTEAVAVDVVSRVLESRRAIESARSNILVTLDGHKVSIENSATQILNEDRVIGTVLVFRDVSVGTCWLF